jgi:hypothetical protein
MCWACVCDWRWFADVHQCHPHRLMNALDPLTPYVARNKGNIDEPSPQHRGRVWTTGTSPPLCTCYAGWASWQGSQNHYACRLRQATELPLVPAHVPTEGHLASGWDSRLPVPLRVD